MFILRKMAQKDESDIFQLLILTTMWPTLTFGIGNVKSKQ